MNGGEPRLERTLTLRGAVTLNMLDMIGVGPFITLPLILAAMGGPQAMVGWMLGAVLALCDGLVWAELGAAMPEAGGSYAYPASRCIRGAWDAMAGAFLLLFIFQLTCFGAAVGGVGCIGAGAVCGRIVAGVGGACGAGGARGRTAWGWRGPATLVAIAAVLVAVFLLYRGLRLRVVAG